jgi:hypothetical protein
MLVPAGIDCTPALPTQSSCARCGEKKPIDRFNIRRDHLAPGPYSHCKDCKNRKRAEQRRTARAEGRSRTVKSSQQANARWAAKNPDRVLLIAHANSTLRNAIKRGRVIKRDECQSCGATQVAIEAAHRDYSRPLDVRWLCRPCHRRWDLQCPKTLSSEVAP